MEEVRGAKLNEIIKQLGLNEGSPDANKSQKLVNIHRINARGKGLKFVPVKRPVTFALRAPGFDQDDITIIVTAPSGREVPTRIDTLRPGAYEVEYITPEVGDHIIEVLACGQAITGSPFHSSGYDASKIKVAPMPSGVVGKAVEFEIDGSEGGSGNLEILVNGGHVTSEVKCLGNHRFVASFVPHAATTHIVEMKFNDDSVPGSPWTCNVSNPDSLPPLKGSLRVHTLDTFCVGQTQFFDVIAVGHSQNDLSVKIMGPLKTSIAHRIVDLQNNSYRVYFSAPNVGPYSFEVSIPSEPNSRHNFIAKAYDVSRIHVSNVPKNVLLNETCSFQVDASQAGEGQLEIAVNDGDVPNQVQVQGNGRCQVSFKPDVCAPHVVDIKFNGQNVPSCPFSVEVSDSSQFSFDLTQLELIAVGRVCKFRIESKNSVEADAMRVVITSPTGKQVPVNLFFRDSGISCEFQAIEVGPHVMTIEYKGRSITSNPLFIKTYDSQKVLVTPATFGYVGKSMQFVVDASSSGEGNLEIAVNAKGINVMTQVHPMGGAKFGVSFTPSEVCDHVVFVTFNNEPVPGKINSF
jgi:filamin